MGMDSDRDGADEDADGGDAVDGSDRDRPAVTTDAVPGATDAAATCEAVLTAVGEAVVADTEFLETILTGVLARGHVLLEDVPGTGKTLTARSLATALGLDFRRVQFTPDLLPADITGSYVYDERAGEFEFSAGPIFANVVLADEINRAPPKTQAALLEAMEEGQVTVDGTSHALPDPFLVMATQNPVEQEGTFPLPEAQRDRFAIKSSIGYPDREGERALIDRRLDRATMAPQATQVTDAPTIRALQQVPESVRVAPDLREYVIDVGRATRTDDRAAVGVSPRGIQRLVEAARARAVVRGREYAVPEDVKRMAHPVFDHRIVLTAAARVDDVAPGAIVDRALGQVAVPAMDMDTAETGDTV